jgi:uncharacterized sodium:solute symporter family permease YidK
VHLVGNAGCDPDYPALVGSIIPESGQGISQQAVTGSILSSLERINTARRKKGSVKKKKSTDFKPLKFNL